MLSLKERFSQKKANKKIKQLDRKAKEPTKRLSHYQHKQTLRQAIDNAMQSEKTE